MGRTTKLKDGRYCVSLDLTEEQHAVQVRFHEENPDYIGLHQRVRVIGTDEVGSVIRIDMTANRYTVELGPFQAATEPDPAATRLVTVPKHGLEAL